MDALPSASSKVMATSARHRLPRHVSAEASTLVRKDAATRPIRSSVLCSKRVTNSTSKQIVSGISGQFYGRLENTSGNSRYGKARNQQICHLFYLLPGWVC